MRNRIVFLLMGLTIVAALAVENSLKHVPDTSQPASAVLEASTEQKKYYKVINVVDGDTVVVLMDGKEEHIRIIGLDTPETVDPRKPVQCFGMKASNKAHELLIGQEVGLEADPTQADRDRYNRLLRYVILFDGTNFAQKMIAEGYGHEYTYALPYKYQNEFKGAERVARENGLGLWAECRK